MKVFVSTTLFAVGLSAPGDAMCTITGWFGADEPSCNPIHGDKGTYLELIPST